MRVSWSLVGHRERRAHTLAPAPRTAAGAPGRSNPQRLLQAEMRLLLLVPLLLAPAPGSSVSAALPGPREDPAGEAGTGTRGPAGSVSRKATMGWEEASPPR